jgi:PleD family two-component response regulator
VDCEAVGSAKVWFLREITEKEKELKVKILVVDDDKNVITIVRDILEPDLFEVNEAMTGHWAWCLMLSLIVSFWIL